MLLIKDPFNLKKNVIGHLKNTVDRITLQRRAGKDRQDFDLTHTLTI